jgi:hypothetical protein
MTIRQAKTKPNALGLTGKNPDHELDLRTMYQLRTFQNSHGLRVTGALVAATSAELAK